MDILKKINWKQPKYMLPLIIYFPLLLSDISSLTSSIRKRLRYQTTALLLQNI